ncbi:DUF2188 domain-containing protein [Actinotalea sp. JY-7876]|uniref:DUF2188 domain-containing protein n=1 Tax=Actinotalea sp. JY-7876 TaxID=2758442 RepID=UPI0015F6264C|nr:DUF2188 domain-containing protein [Actinotalea sp. JY-7876]
MVQVHTVYEAYTWRNMVDGLQQGTPWTSRTTAVAEGRAIAIELACEHSVHDVDGSVLERRDYGAAEPGVWPGAMRYTA